MSIPELLDPRDPPTGADPEPTTFADLEAAGWTCGPGSVGKRFRRTQIGIHEVIVFRDGTVSIEVVDDAAPLSEADAVRLAHRLATVLRAFVPTP